MRVSTGIMCKWRVVYMCNACGWLAVYTPLLGGVPSAIYVVYVCIM